MKAIETVYNGYRFRSRLEARVAKFLDTLGLDYKYELEGFEFDGTRYLPDFYLPKFDYYIEAKGDNPHLAEDIAKVDKFVQNIHKSVIIITDIPFDKGSKGLYWFPAIHWTSKYISPIEHNFVFFQSFDDGDVIIQDDYGVGCSEHWPYGSHVNIQNISPKLGANLDVFTEHQRRKCRDNDYEEWLGDPESEVQIKNSFNLEPVEKALMEARQARFEFGE